MIEIIGDLFKQNCQAICVTTNGVVKKSGALVMGAGVALEAAERIQLLPYELGSRVKRMGNIPHLILWCYENPNGQIQSVVSFPTKHHWKDKSDIKLIDSSAKRLVEICNEYRWSKIVLTRPGCGNGGLQWNMVKKQIEPILDDRFFIITPK